MRAYIRFTLRHGRLLWICAVLLAIPAFVRMAGLYLHLQSDIEALLPKRAPSVLALDELRARMPGLRFLGILVDTGTEKNLPAAEKFLDDLGDRVRTYPPTLVSAVKTGVTEERKFLEGHAVLYADLEDLETIRDRIEARRDAAVSKAMGADLGGDDEADQALDFRDLEAKYRAKEKDAARFPHDRFSSPEKKLSLLLIEVAQLTTGADLGNDLFARVHRDIQELGGTDRYAPGMRIGYTGDIAIDHEELAALVQDLTVSSLAVAVLVLAALVLFYRWWRSIPALLLPLSVGATYAYALVTLPPLRVANLNSNTAFLGSVIVGNGINFGIIFLARYVEERRIGRGIEDALVLALWGSRIGTLVAALAAAAAYGSLSLTQFRGFQQFGIIGGLGMVICWVSAFLLGPPLIAWLDRRDTSTRARVRRGRPLMERVALLVTRHPAAIVLGALVITVATAGKLRGFGRDSIEYDFSNLRRADSRVSGEAFWGRKMDDLLGRYLTPLVLLGDSRFEAERLSRALTEASKAPPLLGVIDSVVSIDDVVPRDQAAKIAVARQIGRDLTPRIRASLDEEQRLWVDRYLGGESLEPIDAGDLPKALTTGLRERDGTFGKAVLVYPRPSHATWQGPAILEMTSTLRGVAESSAQPPSRAARLAGSIPLSADIISSIERDGPRATLFALLAVVALVALIFRLSLATPLILGSLVLAVVWLGGSILALGLKINFCNFIAFPITFGIGVDYAVNVMARYREGNSFNVEGAIQSTGGAVGLCSLTTIIGYGSLLFAQNQALFLFGVVAVLGEIACVLTAIIVLPAVLVLLRGGSAPAVDSSVPPMPS